MAYLFLFYYIYNFTSFNIMEKSEKDLYEEIDKLVASNNLELIKKKYNILLNEIKVLESIKYDIETLIQKKIIVSNSIKDLERKSVLLEEIWKKLYYKRSFISIIEKRIYHFFFGAKVKYKNQNKNYEVLKVYKLCEHANQFCTCADFSYLSNKITVKNSAGIEIAVDKSLLERAE